MILRSGQTVAWFPAVTVPDAPYIATGANLGVGGTCFYASSQAQRPTSMIAVFKNLLPASIQEVDDPESPAALCSDSATDSAGEGGERQQALIHSFRSASSTRQIDAKTTKNAAEESVSLFASDASALPRQPAWPFSMPDVQPSFTGVRVDSGAGSDMPPKRLRSEGSAGVAQNTDCAADASSPTRAAIAGPAELKVGVTTGQAGFFSDNQQAQLSIAAIGELTPKRVDGSTGRLPHGGEQSTPVLQESQTIALISTQAGTTDVVAQSTLQGEGAEAPRPISQGLALGRGASANSFDGDRDQNTEKAGNSPKTDFPPQLAESVATAKRQNPADWSDSPAAVSTQSRQVGGVALDPSVQSQSGGSASSSLAIAISPQPDSTDVSGHVLALDWRRSSTAGTTGSGLGKESEPGQIASSQSPSFTAAPSSSRIEPTAPQPGSTGSVTLKESLAWFVSSTTCPADPGLGKESAPDQIASSQSPSFTAAPSSSRIEPTAPQPGSTGSVTLKESLAWSGSPTTRPAEFVRDRAAALSQFAPGQRPSSAVSLSAPSNDPFSPQPDSNGFVSHQNPSDWSGSYAPDSLEWEGANTTAQTPSAQVLVNRAPDRLKAPLVASASLQADSSVLVTPTVTLQFNENPSMSSGSTSGNAEMGLGRYDRREIVQTPALPNKPTGGEHVRVDQSGGIANTGTAQTTVTSTVFATQNEAQEASRPLALDSLADGVQESTLAGQPSRSRAISSIEVQVQLQSDSQIGLRFVDRQGHIEVQMKSADQQAAQTLIEGLDGLKSSLAREGWSVESQIPARLNLAAGTTQESNAFVGTSTPNSQSSAASLVKPAWVDGTPSFEESHVHGLQEHTGSAQNVRSEPSASAPLSHRIEWDSSTSQDRSRPEHGGTSGRKEQQHSADHGSRDSEKQGRRPTHNTETWMDSIESLLSQPTPAKSSAGA